MDTALVEKKRPGHLFKKGQSGNPAGRPKGTKNKNTLMRLQLEGELRTQLIPHMGAILTKAIDMALAGDKEMIKLLVDKTLPTVKGSDDDGDVKEKVQIFIGRLPERKDEGITINGEVVDNGS